MSSRPSVVAFDLNVSDLYTYEGIQKVHHAFLTFIQGINPDDYQLLLSAYQNYQKMPSFEQEDICLKIAPYIEDFISYLFPIYRYVHFLQNRHQDFAVVAKVKRLFIQRFVALQKRAVPTSKPEITYTDIEFAQCVAPLLDDLTSPELEPFIDYALWQMNQPHPSPLFKLPAKKTPTAAFFENIHLTENGYTCLSNHSLTSSFSCTDQGISLDQAYDQSAYCIKCHPNGRDSCSKGLRENEDKKGCPLKVKVSPMMGLLGQGYVISALAVICVDNPMVALTGHRICNDCRLACIYQKQEPVDVPGTESFILKDVLSLPYGFEIYSLLTRWNPLKFDMPLMQQETGHTVLVVGQGPAGIALSQSLMYQGVKVCAIDGLKIEPLPPYLLKNQYAIRNIHEHLQNLEDRITYGFGGVAEYGITIRWDKNNLFIVRLLLERNARYRLKGGVRYGSQITHEQAVSLGFDHIALCTGAGSPKMMNFQNRSKEFPVGVRFASDFLMALQLTGVYKKESVANLTVDLPIVVIGGGLTAIDTATEAQRYYLRQIEKTQSRIQKIKEDGRFDEFLKSLTNPEKQQLNRWLDHATQLEDEKEKAHKKGTPFNALTFLHQHGGATVLYRKDIKDAPSVKLNVEEVEKALAEGIFIKDNIVPQSFVTDINNQLQGIQTEDGQVIPAKSTFIAIGTYTQLES